MASVNKVILMGNLGRDPEIRYMPNGEAVANFSIATVENWKDKSGVRQEKTEWHNIVMYRRQAEIAGEYLKKGYPVYLEGRLQTRKWEKDGVTRYTTEIVADQMQMLNRNDNSNSQSSNDDYDGGQQQQHQPQTARSNNEQGNPNSGNGGQRYAAFGEQNNTNGGGSNFSSFDDDIPFGKASSSYALS